MKRQRQSFFEILMIVSAILYFTISLFFFANAFGDDNRDIITLADFGNEEFSFQERHYIIYNVNPGEGFNLRRDVYMRISNVVRQLRELGKNYF